jgi:hypothetical protein
MAPNASMPPGDVTRAIAPFLKRLAATPDPAKFGALLAPVGPQIRTLLEQGHLDAAWRLRSTLDLVAADPPGPLSRAEHAKKALEAFDDPQVLAPLADRALDGLEDRERHASKLILRAGRRGAHALYQARLKHGVFEARERFVALMGQMGTEGTIVIKNALELLATRLAVSGAAAVAEDLLKALPDMHDDTVSPLVAGFARSEHPQLALAATNAIPRACPGNTRGLLRAQLHHKEPDVVIASLKLLRAAGAVDTQVLEDLRPVIVGTMSARPSVRLAATEALCDVTPEARGAAHTLLAQALAATTGSTPDVEDMVVMISHTLITIGGDGSLVAERWKKSQAWLRTRLEALLRRGPPTATG